MENLQDAIRLTQLEQKIKVLEAENRKLNETQAKIIRSLQRFRSVIDRQDNVIDVLNKKLDLVIDYSKTIASLASKNE